MNLDDIENGHKNLYFTITGQVFDEKEFGDVQTEISNHFLIINSNLDLGRKPNKHHISILRNWMEKAVFWGKSVVK